MSNQEKLTLKVLVTTILLLLVLHLLHLNSYIFVPFVSFAEVVFFPFVVTCVIYYLLRPLVRWLSAHKVHPGLAVLLIYLTLGSTLFGISMLAGPIIRDQFLSFSNQIPEMVDAVTNGIQFIRDQENSLPGDFIPMPLGLSEGLLTSLQDNANYVADGLVRALSGISSALIALFLVPFILYYALKDGQQLPPRLIKAFPATYRKYVAKLLEELDQTIASYILGQATVSFCVGVLLWIGYSIIGLEYSLVLAFIGMLFNIVPFLGPILATLPALLVALFQEPLLALYVLLVSIIAQQIEGNFISPQVMGRSLDIHPLTVIILLFSAGSLLGILGIIFIVPAYAIIKVFIEQVWKIYQMQRSSAYSSPTRL